MTSMTHVGHLTIGQMLDETVERHGESDAIVFPQLDVRMSWRVLNQAVDAAARALLGIGLAPGDHLGVWSTNCPEWVILQFATAKIGVVLVTLNPLYGAEELAFAVAHSKIKCLALSDQFKTTDFDQILHEVWPAFASAEPGKLNCEKFPHLQTVVRVRGRAHPAMLSWDEFVSVGQSINDDQLAQAAATPKPDDPINLQYTSGTTGNPKGALLTHRNLLLNAFYAGRCQRITHEDRICISVPLYHCFGCVLGVMCAVVRGPAMVFPSESFRADATLQCIESERCTAVYGVPTMFIAMFEQPEFSSRDLRSLRTGIMAGSPCPIELMKRVTTEMGAREITIAYGQTEASPLITMTHTDDPIDKRVGTVGKAIPGVETKIIDQQGNAVECNVSGELCARGHNVMLGYYDNPEQTAKTIDAEGWLHTGDLALKQPDGYFRITGRLKDVIIRGGENISPREIEELLYTHPAVEDVQVLGVPDRKFGEQVLACIRVRSGADLTEDEVREFCREHLARFKTPHYVWFVDDYPTTATGKIQKFRLRELATEHFGLQGDASVETA